MFNSSTKLIVSFSDTSMVDKGQFNLYLVIITKAVSFPPIIAKYR